MATRTEVAMGTLVTIQVVRCGTAQTMEAAMERAFAWFHEIEAHCSRFDQSSELMQLSARIGVPSAVSDILFETVRLALRVAEESGGAFDPTVGRAIEARGFNREHRSGEVVDSAIDCPADISFRDVELDEERRTITLLRPLILDLGAVAKGLAVDTAARELHTFKDFAIDAGGDLYLGGCNADGEPWHVGIRHPSGEGQIDSLRVSDKAVCTSGNYERQGENGAEHIIDPRRGDPRRGDPRRGVSAGTTASATVIAPSAMLADALATAAFVLGPGEGIPFLERLGVEGLLVTPELARHETQGLRNAG